MINHDTVAVRTRDDVATLIRDGFSGDWYMNINKAAQMKYIMVVSNQSHNKGEVVLLAVISKMERVADVDHPGRWRARFHFEQFIEPGYNIEWAYQNPVRYFDSAQLAADVKSANWRSTQHSRNLRVEHYRRKIAEELNVSPEAVKVEVTFA